MASRLELVTGGMSSGKSAWCERQALLATPEWARPVIITPCDPIGMNMTDKVAVHQAKRDPRFVTMERFDLTQALREVPPDAPVIVDALDTWLAQTMHDGHAFEPDVSPSALAKTMHGILDSMIEFGHQARLRQATTWVIAGVPGLGMVPVDAVVTRSVEWHGEACQALTPDHVWFIHVGRPLMHG